MGKTPSRGRRPATTPEAREAQLISMAYDLAEKQIREGSASVQVVTHFLKLGSTRERLEQERIQRENLLLSTRAKKMEQDTRTEELMEEALNAFRHYSGQDVEDYTDYFEGGDVH